MAEPPLRPEPAAEGRTGLGRLRRPTAPQRCCRRPIGVLRRS